MQREADHQWRILGAIVYGLFLIAPPAIAETRNLSVSSVVADHRVALVIGNSAYESAPLKNPVNDADDISSKLRSLGFQVLERKNLKTGQMGRTLREFKSMLQPGGVALVFYAGHGFQIKGENYLPTVDADIQGEEDVPSQSIALRQIVDLLDESKSRINLIFLDACRNNPYSRSFRSSDSGLARVSAGSGTLISYATKPGSVAADGDGRNGLYTQTLLQAIGTPDLPVELMLKRVTSGVKAVSKGQQEPWMEGSIEGDFYFSPGGAGSPQANRTAIRDSGDSRPSPSGIAQSSVPSRDDSGVSQASIDRMVAEALARQSMTSGPRDDKKLEEPRRASDPTVVASLTPSSVPNLISSNWSPQAGQEWEYEARDNIFGKTSLLTLKVKAFSPRVGLMEEVFFNGRSVTDWVSTGIPAYVAVPTESKLMLAPGWDGTAMTSIRASGQGECVSKYSCVVANIAIGPAESLHVQAGDFDVIKISGTLMLTAPRLEDRGYITTWYSPRDRRVIKQNVEMRSTQPGFITNETIELVRVSGKN